MNCLNRSNKQRQQFLHFICRCTRDADACVVSVCEFYKFQLENAVARCTSFSFNWNLRTQGNCSLRDNSFTSVCLTHCVFTIGGICLDVVNSFSHSFLSCLAQSTENNIVDVVLFRSFGWIFGVPRSLCHTWVYGHVWDSQARILEMPVICCCRRRLGRARASLRHSHLWKCKICIKIK